MFVTYCTSSKIGNIGVMYDHLTTVGKLSPVSGNRGGSYLTFWSIAGLKFGILQTVSCWGMPCLSCLTAPVILSAGSMCCCCCGPACLLSCLAVPVRLSAGSICCCCYVRSCTLAGVADVRRSLLKCLQLLGRHQHDLSTGQALMCFCILDDACSVCKHCLCWIMIKRLYVSDTDSCDHWAVSCAPRHANTTQAVGVQASPSWTRPTGRVPLLHAPALHTRATSLVACFGTPALTHLPSPCLLFPDYSVSFFLPVLLVGDTKSIYL